jgi:MFS family permease
MSVPAAGSTLLTRPFVLLTLANFALSIAGAFAIHLPGLLSELGAREAELGRILAMHALMAALLGPVVGRLMDRHGRRPLIRVGGVLALIVSGCYTQLDRLGPQLYALRALDGAASTLLYATMFAYAAELVPVAQRTRGIALFGASGLAPMAISSQLGDLILARADYHTMFATSALFCALGTALCWVLPESRPVAHADAEPPHGMLRVARQRELLPIWCAALAFFCCLAGVLAFMKPFVLATGYGSVGAFFSVYVLMALSLRVFLGGLPDRIGLRRMVLPAVGSYALGILAIAHASGAASLLLAGALCGIGHGYGFPVLLSLVVARAQPQSRGTATGIYTAIDWSGNLLAPPLLGLLIERAGYGVGFTTFGALAALGLTAFYVLDREPSS